METGMTAVGILPTGHYIWGLIVLCLCSCRSGSMRRVIDCIDVGGIFSAAFMAYAGIAYFKSD